MILRAFCSAFASISCPESVGYDPARRKRAAAPDLMVNQIPDALEYVLTGMVLARIRNAMASLSSPTPAALRWLKEGDGRLRAALPTTIPRSPRKIKIEDLAWRTDRGGARTLHEAYGQSGATRRPDEVRSSSTAGNLYAWLVSYRKPEVVVEFGSAFGVSGMYWLAGIEKLGRGHLYSFEMNLEWAEVARRNISAIGRRFTLTPGAFEELVGGVLNGRTIDIAFVDGIHTADFILRQFEIIREMASPRSLILFDDIDFSSGRMAEGWTEIWRNKAVQTAFEFNGHTGIVELG